MSRKSELLRKKEQMEITLPVLIDHYVTAKKVAGCSTKTLINLRSNLNKFVHFLQGQGHSLRLSDIHIQQARAYIASLQGEVTKFEGHPINKPIPGYHFSPVTIHTHTRHLRTFSTWLTKEGWTKHPIFELLELPKLPQTRIDVLKEEEIKQILSTLNSNTAIGARMYAMVLCALDTGVRRGELATLKLLDVDWERGVFKVFGKGSKERLVPVGHVAKQAMLRYVQVFRQHPARPEYDTLFLSVDGYPLSVDAVGHLFERLAKRSGITRLHAHLLRHTNGVLYLTGGGDTKSLQMFLGHSSPFMTHHYEQLKDEHVLAQHRKFSPVDKMQISARRFAKKQKDMNAKP